MDGCCDCVDCTADFEVQCPRLAVSYRDCKSVSVEAAMGPSAMGPSANQHPHSTDPRPHFHFHLPHTFAFTRSTISSAGSHFLINSFPTSDFCHSFTSSFLLAAVRGSGTSTRLLHSIAAAIASANSPAIRHALPSCNCPCPCPPPRLLPAELPCTPRASRAAPATGQRGQFTLHS
mgnify:CR=1 FL=1